MCLHLYIRYLFLSTSANENSKWRNFNVTGEKWKARGGIESDDSRRIESDIIGRWRYAGHGGNLQTHSQQPLRPFQVLACVHNQFGRMHASQSIDVQVREFTRGSTCKQHSGNSGYWKAHSEDRCEHAHFAQPRKASRRPGRISHAGPIC